MPFDFFSQTGQDRRIIAALVQQADEACEANDRDTCIGIIQQIFELLDSHPNLSGVEPAQVSGRTVPRIRVVNGDDDLCRVAGRSWTPPARRATSRS